MVTLEALGCGTLESLTHLPLLVSQCWAPTDRWTLHCLLVLDQGALSAHGALEDSLVAAYCGLSLRRT